MGAHSHVRAPPPSMLVSDRPTRFLLLLVLVFLIMSTVHAHGSDAETLIEFKDSLINGDNLTSWINTNTTPCNDNWEGVLCTNGNIWGIRLEGKGLEGSIDPTILARLPSLVSISLKNNSLEGTLPDFRTLGGMREIFLSNNRFYGEIKDHAFDGLNRLTKLYLAHNELMGHIPLSLTSLPKLKELVLDNNHFDGHIPNFQKGKLTLVNFAHNLLHGRIPEGLRGFPSQDWLFTLHFAEMTSKDRPHPGSVVLYELNKLRGCRSFFPLSTYCCFFFPESTV